MRIVSLVPHATELLFALELDDEVVGATHECDYPWAATSCRRSHGTGCPRAGSAGEIDAAVREKTLAGESIYELDEDTIRELEPDLIVTQELCTVCAVSHQDVVAFAQTLDKVPEVVTLDPHTLGEALGDVRTIAGHTDRKDEGVDWSTSSPAASTASGSPRAAWTVRRCWPSSGSIRCSSAATGCHSSSTTPRERTCSACRASLGDRRVGGRRGGGPRHRPHHAVRPHGALEARDEALEHWGKIERLGAARVIAVEANAYFSRRARVWSTASSSSARSCIPPPGSRRRGQLVRGPLAQRAVRGDATGPIGAVAHATHQKVRRRALHSTVGTPHIASSFSGRGEIPTAVMATTWSHEPRAPA